MHELTIAQGILDQTLRAIAGKGNIRVEEVEIHAGVLRQIVPDAMEIAWQAVTKGTAAEGSGLKLKEVPASAHCRPCGNVFQPEIDSYICPRCNQADVEIVEGKDIILMSLTCRKDDEDIQ